VLGVESDSCTCNHPASADGEGSHDGSEDMDLKKSWLIDPGILLRCMHVEISMCHLCLTSWESGLVCESVCDGGQRQHGVSSRKTHYIGRIHKGIL
jgi:hypothetical protein